MRRRELMIGAIAAGAASLPPRAARAEAPPARIGLLSIGTDPDPNKPNPVWLAFLGGLAELGRVENRNLTVERRFAGGNSQLLAKLVAELAALRLDVVVATGEPESKAVAQAMPDMPLVMVLVPDPVGAGLAASLARPGGHVTGLSTMAPETYAKRMQFLADAVPGLDRVGLLANPAISFWPLALGYSERAAQTLGIALRLFPVQRPEELQAAFDAVTREGVRALLVVTDGVIFNQRQRVAQLAAAARVPAIYENRIFVDSGGLFSYGPSYSDLARRAAGYVDRILNGAKPGDLPIAQPTKFELVINQTTARALGFAVPQLLLQQADEVIE